MAGFMLSPGVQVSEKDFTSIVPAVSTSVGATAGIFKWGPVMEPIRVSSENELVQRFGGPTDIVKNGVSYSNAPSFFAAANFLSYSSNLLVTRAPTPKQKNAMANALYSVDSITASGVMSGYAVNDVITVAAPASGYGVAATARVKTVSSGSITEIEVLTSGSGYASGEVVTATESSSGTGASFTVNLVKSGIAVNNSDAYDAQFTSLNQNGIYGAFMAKYPGSIANGIVVSIADSSNFATWTYKANFNSAPTGNELHVIIVDSTGVITGTPGSILESYAYLNKASDAKNADGTNAYYVTVLNNSSSWVYWIAHPAGTSGWGATTKDSNNANNVFSSLTLTTGNVSAASGASTITIPGTGITTANIYAGMSVTCDTAGKVDAGTVVVSKTDTTITISKVLLATITTLPLVLSATATATFSGGADDFDYTTATSALTSAFQIYANSELYDISLIVAGKANATLAGSIIDIASTRLDCLAFVSPEYSAGDDIGSPIIGSSTNTATDLIAYKNAVNRNTSYGVMDSGHKYQYDRYNDVYRWIPLNGDIAGLCARADFTDDPWFSPAGYSRGQIKGVVKLAYNPNSTARDTLYKEGINCVVSFPGQGTVLYGDKTLLSKPSAFDRINVRRLFIVLEKAIATAAKYQLFEFNDQFTRAQFRSMVEPFLRDIQGRRGITDFRVKCDETNNTGQIIESNQFVADIFVKPARSINFISLTFVAARQSVSFEEIGG